MANTKYKTKFPMARIKKIMQVDEEIGKVSQTTPIVISKALEMFLEKMIQNAASLLEPTNTKISPGLIKKLILNTEEYDFLRQLASKLPEYHPPTEPTSPSKRRASSRRASTAKAHPPQEQGSDQKVSTEMADEKIQLNQEKNDLGDEQGEEEDCAPIKRSKINISALISHDDTNSD